MPQGDKSSYTGKQRREAHHIEEGYKKRGLSSGEAERRAWATVNKQDGGAKGKSSKSHSGHSKSSSSHSSSSHSGGHSGHRKSSRSHHSGGHSASSHSRSRSRSRSGSSSSRSRGRSRSRSFTLFGLKLPKSTPYILGGLGLCGLVFGLLQIDVISDAVDPVIDDIGGFLGLSEKPDMVTNGSFNSSMPTIQ